MSLVLFDRVKETTTTTGTGSLTLGGASSGFTRFGDVLTVLDTFFYCIEDPNTGDWEIGLGTYSGTNTLARTSILRSSNANAAVSFASGTKNVFIVDPATSSATKANKRALLGFNDVVQQPSAPTTLTAGQEVTITHPAVTNEKISINVMRDAKATGQANTSLDFDLADESQFTQQDATNGTDFADGVVKLHDTGGGSPVQYPTSAMTSDSAPSPFATSAQSVFGGNAFPAYLAFDRSIVSGSRYVSNSPTGWLKIDLGSAVVVTSYKMTYVDYGLGNAPCPKDFTLEGSNNNSTWTTVDTVTNKTVWASGTEYTFSSFTNTTAYRYYRINVSANNGYGAYWQIDEVKLFASSSSYPTSQPYYVTTNTNQIPLYTGTVGSVKTINSIAFTTTTPTNTGIKMLVSFDGRTTWKKWNGSSWATHTGGLSNLSTGNTLAEVVTGLTAYSVQVADTFLDLAWDLSTSDASVTPSIDAVSINYDEDTYYDMASVGSYASGAEFGVRRLTATTTKVKNMMASSQKCFINVRVDP